MFLRNIFAKGTENRSGFLQCFLPRVATILMNMQSLKPASDVYACNSGTHFWSFFTAGQQAIKGSPKTFPNKFLLAQRQCDSRVAI
jgi:hypothetical protein